MCVVVVTEGRAQLLEVDSNTQASRCSKKLLLLHRKFKMENKNRVIDILLHEYIRKIDIKNLRKTLEGKSCVDSFITKDCSTAMHLASSLSDEADCLTVAEFFLALGANPNVPDKEGKTSLHIAASMGYSRLLDLLLVNGGDPLLGDMKGQLPVDCAYHQHHLEIVKQLTKLLDTENYAGAQENSHKYSLSFLRQEVVEFMNISPSVESKSDEYYSCDSNQHKEEHRHRPSSPTKEDSKVMNHWISSDESLSQESFFIRYNTTHISETDKVSQVQDVNFSSDYIPPWINNNNFLQYLKQKVEACYTDSDSDNDMRSLRRCLGNKIKHGTITFHESFDSAQELESFTDPPSEFDIAHLTIDITLDANSEDGNQHLNGTYMPPKNNLFFPDGQIISNSLQDIEENTEIHKNEFDYTLNNTTVHPTNKTFMDHEKKSQMMSSNLPTKILGDNKEFHKEVFPDVTAPENILIPEAYTTVTLIKAPKKKKISKKKKYSSSLKNFTKQVEELYKDSFSSDDSNNVDKLAGITLTQKPQASAQLLPPLSLKSSPIKTVCSSGSSCQSFVSVVEEFLYEDPEAGVKLIERRCPTTVLVTSISTGASRTLTLGRQTAAQKLPAAYAYTDRSQDSVGSFTESVKAMNAEELRTCLIKLGYVPGPIVATTHRIYQRHLLRLRNKPQLLKQCNLHSIPKYPRQLQAALEDPLSIDWESCSSLEKVMSAPFCQPDPTRHWRDGTNKTCFNYLLLDPRVTQDLPLRGPAMNDADKLQCFISAIFYIGKGSRGRPYYHLYEAIKQQNSGKRNSEKIKRIHNIWSDGVGVVSLHVFQNTIPVEAWTREAAMISAIGLENLCNSIQGTFYGLPSTWSWAERRQLGTHLLYRTLNIFMNEGERQLRPSDIAPPDWMK